MFEYQRVIAEINLDNIAHNMREIKKITGENTKIMAVVKADGYGHGSLEVSKTVLYNGADSLAVAICDEGVQLRENNIHVPILVLGYTPQGKMDEIIKYNLIQTVFSYEMAENISNSAKKLNKTAQIHIKIDTGMGRIGFTADEEGIEEILKINSLPNIHITGVFTHFAISDKKDKSFTFEQFEKFKYVIKKLKENGINNLISHASNSGAILDLNELNSDMVRAGIILYGLYPSKEVLHNINLKPAMSIKTHISFIKTVGANTSIGYGRTYFTDKKTVVATVPVGYADGYSRILSNKARVIVNGKYCNIIGSICMDQFMIDVTECENIKVNDEVVLIGQQGECEITAEEIAYLQDTINYEIICNVGKRVPRVYIKNGEILKTVKFI